MGDSKRDRLLFRFPFKEMKLNNFISSLWYRDRARRWAPLNTLTREFGRKWRAQCVNTSFTLPICGIQREVENTSSYIIISQSRNKYNNTIWNDYFLILISQIALEIYYLISDSMRIFSRALSLVWRTFKRRCELKTTSVYRQYF